MTPGNRGKYNFFSRNCKTHNQNGQFKTYEKDLSSTSVDNERP